MNDDFTSCSSQDVKSCLLVVNVNDSMVYYSTFALQSRDAQRKAMYARAEDCISRERLCKIITHCYSGHNHQLARTSLMGERNTGRGMYTL